MIEREGLFGNNNLVGWCRQLDCISHSQIDLRTEHTKETRGFYNHMQYVSGAIFTIFIYLLNNNNNGSNL